MTESYFRRLVALYSCLILSLYGLSFFLPVSWNGAHSLGYHIFCWGFVGMFVFPFLAFPWLANLFLWSGWIALLGHNYTAARKFGMLATILAASYIPVCFVLWYSDGLSGSLPRFGFGYLFWLFSMAGLAGAGYALEFIMSKCQQRGQNAPTYSHATKNEAPATFR